VKAYSKLQHLLPLAILAALACACDRQSDSKQPDAAPRNPGPKTTKVDRPPRVDAPDARAERRATFTKAREIASPEQREAAIARIAWDALDPDPELAREAFQQLSVDSPERIHLIQHFAMNLAGQNLDEALQWADALASEKEIAAARCQIALVLADSEPERAAALLSESAIAGREFDVAVVQILQHWSASNPPAAAAWVAMFPPGESRAAGIKAVISPWLESDVPAVYSWMEKLGDESLRAEATSAMAGLLMEQSDSVRADWLRQASPAIRAAIELQMKEADPSDPPPSR
jgi:hypothetical protein